MKKFLSFAILLCFLGFLESCSSDSDDPMDEVQPTVVTYTNSVKNIINGNCTNCHGNPTANNAPSSLNTYGLVKTAVESKNLIGRIESGVMPPNGSLSTSQITAIKNWQAGGFIE